MKIQGQNSNSDESISKLKEYIEELKKPQYEFVFTKDEDTKLPIKVAGVSIDNNVLYVGLEDGKVTILQDLSYGT